MSFRESSLSTAEVDAAENLYGPLTADLRRLVDVAIRTEVDADRVAEARRLLANAAAILGEQAADGPAGIHYNAEGRSWNWGNAAVGVRNAIAPPLRLRWDDDGDVRSEASLGVAYEGPPGCVHGGVSAMLLDHLMGETASAAHTQVVVTGTLTLRYVRPLPLGPIHLQGRIARQSGRKVTVTAEIRPEGPGHEPAIEASGLFIVPRWAVELPSDVGSLD